MRVVLVGIGNVLAADDGVGIRILQEFQSRVADERVVCIECERGGLDLLDTLQGFDKGVVIDAARTGHHPCGTVFEFTLRKPFVSDNSPSFHTIGFGGVMALGEAAGMKLPDEITVFGVEAADVETFGSGCTPIVEAAIPDVVARLKSKTAGLIPGLRFTSPFHSEAMT